MTPRPRLLFVCVENSCRSQMAEGFAHLLGGEAVEAFSAGSAPSGVVNPKAVRSMAEIGYDLSKHASKSLDEVPAGEYAAAITMGCGDACPSVPATVHEDWGLPDPKHMEPAEFAEVREQIRARVQDLLTRVGAVPSS